MTRLVLDISVERWHLSDLSRFPLARQVLG